MTELFTAARKMKLQEHGVRDIVGVALSDDCPMKLQSEYFPDECQHPDGPDWCTSITVPECCPLRSGMTLVRFGDEAQHFQLYTVETVSGGDIPVVSVTPPPKIIKG